MFSVHRPIGSGTSLSHLSRLSLIILFLLTLSLSAQEEGPKGKFSTDIPEVTRSLAIIDATIVVRPGVRIERGTVVVRNGLIESVGTDIPVPYDARRVDGKGLTIYAGFIDGYSFAGSPRPEELDQDVEKAGDPPPAVAGITPERRMAERFLRNDKLIDSLRRVGFGLAQVVPRGGMLPGTSSLMLLASRDTTRFVFPGLEALVATFDGADDVYPATPMGIMAKLRNLFRQAEQIRNQETSFASNPNGYPRPLNEPVRYSFFPVIEKRFPVLFRVDDDLEVRRALTLSRELGFRVMLAGLNEGRDIADLVAGSGTPMFLSINFPEEVKDASDKDSTASSSRDDMGRSPLSNDSTIHQGSNPVGRLEQINRRTDDYHGVEGERLQLVAVREESRRAVLTTPAYFARHKVRFGFATTGTDGSRIRENLLDAVRNGLSEDQALAALTTDAATLLGVDRAFGAVEKGKVANLVITNGNYFNDTVSVSMSVVDGMLFDYRSESDEEDDDNGKEREGKDSKKNQTRTITATSPGDPVMPGRAVAMQRDTSGTILVKNGTVLTVTKGKLEGTDVLVVKGKITAIGKGLAAPGGAMVYDATGKFVMPGIVDAHSHIAVSGEVNEWTNPVTAEVRIGDVIDPYDITIYRALAGGVTTSHVMHGSANPIGGECETIKHRYGETDPERLKMEGAPRTIKFALGENPTRVHGRGFHVPPSTRMGVEQVFRDAFTQAQRYMIEKAAYASASRESRLLPPLYDERMETLAAILRGDVLIHCHSYRADEILMLMRVLKDFGIKRVVFQHVNEGFKVAPELAKFGAMASVFSDWWAYKFEVYYSTAYNAAILTHNGVVTSINSDSPELNRHLYHEAAKSLHNGDLTEDECLAMITINPARQLGVEERIGSIEVGKEGDLAIFEGHPLSIYARPVLTVVDGVIRFDALNDPDDMRLRVDPNERIDAVRENFRDADCMEGVDEKH